MQNKFLNIHEFQTENKNSYIFDNVTGIIIPSSKEVKYTIENFFGNEKSEMIEKIRERFNLDNNKALGIYRYTESMINNGMFYKMRDLLSENTTYDEILSSVLSQLILVVTESCNMRCKYCIYSDNYPHIKEYSDKSMSFSIAKKAVDIYIEIHNERRKRGLEKAGVINFYGGEPFLNFDIIKKVVEYCKEQKFETEFYATTNGTILTDEMIDFIIENKMNITFSLDGNKNNHDRNRVMKNNKPTFDLIFKNISKLQKRKKEKNIKQDILFSTCFDLDTDLNEIVNFFLNNNELFEPYGVIYSKIVEYETKYYESANLNENELKNSTAKIYNEFIKLIELDKEIPVPIANLFFGLMLQKFRTKGSCKLGNACVPGGKITVDPNGKIYACEKMSQMYSIGDVETGISLDQVNYIYNKYLAVLNDKCSNCSLSRLCSLCYVHMITNDGFKFNKEFCENSRQNISKSLGLLYSILEKNPNAIDKLLPKANRNYIEATM